ncbi:MAG: hypothetical protein ACLTPG_04955 [Mediterraneibacter gnavus]
MAITSAFTLKANVRNAQSVSFVLTNPDTNTEKTITAEKTEESGAYEACAVCGYSECTWNNGYR